MALHVVNHPLAEHVLSALRDKDTSPAMYRVLCKRIAAVLLTHAFENLELQERVVETPLCPCTTKVFRDPIVFIPVLRAGLALLDPAITLIPEAKVGYFGLQRNEVTAQPEFYYKKLPEIKDAAVFVLDPMLATGGSSAFVLDTLSQLPAKTITMVSVIAAPEGVELLMKKFPSVDIYTTALDEKLNEQKFIVPGLGDFGDRFHGTL